MSVTRRQLLGFFAAAPVALAVARVTRPSQVEPESPVADPWDPDTWEARDGWFDAAGFVHIQDYINKHATGVMHINVGQIGRIERVRFVTPEPLLRRYV